MISGGVLSSLPGQKGQNPLLIGFLGTLKSEGLLPLSVEIITHRPVTGSLRSSDIESSFMYKKTAAQVLAPKP
jgi:hypothetical protein